MTVQARHVGLAVTAWIILLAPAWAVSPDLGNMPQQAAAGSHDKSPVTPPSPVKTAPTDSKPDTNSDVWVARLDAGAATLMIVAGVALLGLCLFNPENRLLTVRRHWGGFGGGVTGWTVSQAVVQLLIAILLIGIGSGILLK